MSQLQFIPSGHKQQQVHAADNWQIIDSNVLYKLICTVKVKIQ